MKNIKKMFLESSFSKVFSIIKKNPIKYIYTIILDFIFLALIVFIGSSLGSLIPTNPQQLMDFFKAKSNILLFSLIYASIYYLLIIFIYSITKLTILKLIKSLYEKSKLNIKGLKKFYSLNILMFFILFSFTLILLIILSLVLKRDFLKYLILILLIPFVFFLYSLINIIHTIFIRGAKKDIIKKSLDITFSRISKYGMFIIWDVILFSIYILFYNLINLIFRFLIFTSAESLTIYGHIYLKTFNIISIIFVYLIISFNRIYFYEKLKNVL